MKVLLCLLFISTLAAYDRSKYTTSTHSDSSLTEKSETKPKVNDGEIDWIEYFDLAKCELLDRCKPCNFKELQKWPECQETGLRLIKQCQGTAFGTVNEEEEGLTQADN